MPASASATSLSLATSVTPHGNDSAIGSASELYFKVDLLEATNGRWTPWWRAMRPCAAVAMGTRCTVCLPLGSCVNWINLCHQAQYSPLLANLMYTPGHFFASASVGSAYELSQQGCAAGYYYNKSQDLCDSCPIGTYRNATASQDHCADCPIGTWCID